MKAELIDEIAELRENIDMYLFHVKSLLMGGDEIGAEVIGQMRSFAEHFNDLSDDLESLDPNYDEGVALMNKLKRITASIEEVAGDLPERFDGAFFDGAVAAKK